MTAISPALREHVVAEIRYMRAKLGVIESQIRAGWVNEYNLDSLVKSSGDLEYLIRQGITNKGANHGQT